MVLKIVIAILVVLAVYYGGLFIYYYRKTKSLKVAAGNTIIMVIPVLIFFFIAEFTFRVVVSNKILLKDNHFFTRHSAIAYYFIYHPRLNAKSRYIRLREHPPTLKSTVTPSLDQLQQAEGLEKKPYARNIDTDGFILPEYKAGKSTIFFIGGSTTECLYMEENNRFPYLVGKHLSNNNLPFTVKNAGYSGNNTFHSINNTINKVLAYQPDIVVLMEAINDLSTLLWERSYHNSNPGRNLVIEDVYGEVTNNGKDEFAGKRGLQQQVDTARVFKEYRDALNIFISICVNKQVTPVLMTQFNRIDNTHISTCKQLQYLIDESRTNFPGIDYISMYKRMNDIVREVATKQNVILIDLDKLVPKSGKYLYDAVHLNDSGSIYTANLIAQHLTKHLQLKN